MWDGYNNVNKQVSDLIFDFIIFMYKKKQINNFDVFIEELFSYIFLLNYCVIMYN